jgi:hypothetical protein
MATACTGDVGTISVSLITAPDSTVLDDVVRARMSISSPPTTVEGDVVDGQLLLDLDVIAEGQAGLVSFEGLDSNGDTIAFGKSGPLPIAAVDAEIVIYVGPPLSLAEAPIVLDPPRTEMGSSLLSFGALFAGGSLADGTSSSDVVVYNVYDHDFQLGEDLPSPRAGPTVITGSSGFVYLFGGRDTGGEDTADAFRFDTNVAPAGMYTPLATGSELARTGASGAALGGEQFLILGNPLVIIDGIIARAAELQAPPLLGLTTTVFFDNVGYTYIVGSGAGAGGGTLFVNGGFVSLSNPPDMERNGHAMTILPGGEMLVAGGETTDGLIADGMRFNAVTRTFGAQPDMLATPRRDAVLAATARYIIVAGGIDETGTIVGDAEVFDAATFERVATLPMLVPRTGATAQALSNGQVIIAGGTDVDGEPVGTIELFTPDE